MTRPLRRQLDRLFRTSLLVAVVGAVLCLLAALLNVSQFLNSYLFAMVFWVGLSLGCMSLVMLHELVGGQWGIALRRILEAGMWPLLAMAVLFIPLLLGVYELYAWAGREALTYGPQVLPDKTAYLNVPFFVGRTIAYFLLWMLLVVLLSHWSRRQLYDPDPQAAARLQTLAAPGMIVYVLTASFASFDWVMSLDYHWFSSILGVIFIVSQGLAALALAIGVMCWMTSRSVLKQYLYPELLYDIGNLMMAGVVLWAYVSFSQYLIIWYGDNLEEIPWYLMRSAGGWPWVAVALIVLHFLVPFFLLLMRDVKRRVKLLGSVAALVVVMHLVDRFWLIAPQFHAEAFHATRAHPPLGVHWQDVVAFVAVGAVWSALFLNRLRNTPLLPAHVLAPRKENVEHA